METPSIHDLVGRYYELEGQKSPLFDLVRSAVNVIQEAFERYGMPFHTTAARTPTSARIYGDSLFFSISHNGTAPRSTPLS